MRTMLRQAMVAAMLMAPMALAQTPAAPAATAAAATKPALGAPLSDAALEKLKQLDERIAQVRDMTTDFTQRKNTKLMKRPLVSEGVIRVKGAVTLWETQKPSKSVMRIDEKELLVYYPTGNTVEVYRLEEQMAKMAASPLPRLALLRQTFEIRELPGGNDARYLALALAPKDAALAQHLALVTVKLDLEQGHMSEMTMVDPDGESTQLSFRNVRINRDLGDSELQLKLPRDVKVSRPLQALEAGK